MKKTIALFLALIMVLSLAACGTAGSGSDTSVSKQTSESAVKSENKSADTSNAAEPDDGAVETKTSTGELVIGTTEGSGGFDRALTHGDASNVILPQAVWDSLFVINADTKEVEPLMAESYEWLDETSLHIVLKEGIVADDGEPITAEDVIWSYERNILEESQRSSYFDAYDFEKTWAELSSPDALDFVLYYKSEFGPGISYLESSIAPVYPKDWATEGAGVEDGVWWDSPNATGPYRCVENVDGSHVTFELRDNYYGDTTGYPTKITLKLYTEQTALFSDYAAGTLDAAFGLAAGDVETLQNGGLEDTTVMVVPKNDVYAMCLCPYTEYFQDENVRMAIAHAIDAEGVAFSALGVLGTAATSTLPSGVNYYTDVGTYEYDPELAAEYLSKSKWPDGFTLDTVVVTNDATTVAIATAVQAYLSAIGIDMQFEAYSIPVAITEYFITGVTQCLFKNCMEGSPSLDPNQIYDTIGYRSTNIAATVSTDENDEFNTHLYAALSEIDSDARAEDYTFVQQYLKDTGWQIPLIEANYGYCFRSSVISSFNVVAPSIPNFRYVQLAG